MQETRTAGIAAKRLNDAGYEVTTGVGKTGVVGILRNGDGPTVMLRADMDALPVKEANGPALRERCHGERCRRQHRPGDARVRARHARDLAGWSDEDLRGGARHLARHADGCFSAGGRDRARRAGDDR